MKGRIGYNDDMMKAEEALQNVTAAADHEMLRLIQMNEALASSSAATAAAATAAANVCLSMSHAVAGAGGGFMLILVSAATALAAGVAEAGSGGSVPGAGTSAVAGRQPLQPAGGSSAPVPNALPRGGPPQLPVGTIPANVGAGSSVPAVHSPGRRQLPRPG